MSESREKQHSEPASDFELAIFFCRHIDHPCEVVVKGRSHNIRDFYLRLAREILPRMTDQGAKELLEEKIVQYSPEGEKKSA